MNKLFLGLGITLVVLLALVGVLLYIMYMYNPALLNGMVDARYPLELVSENLVKTQNEFTLSFWYYVEGWKYKYNEKKTLLNWDDGKLMVEFRPKDNSMVIIMKDLNGWINEGQIMMAQREKKIKRAKSWKFDTVATHGLYDLQQALSSHSGSIMEPVYMSPAQAYSDCNEMEAALSYQIPTWCYSRIANPSTYFLEETIALLETYGSDIIASGLATSSGMSAIKTATDPFLVKDDKLPPPNIVSCAKVYGGTFQQFWIRRYQEQGIEVRWICDPGNLDEWLSKIDNGTRFVYGEFPSNPSLTIFDIESVAELAHSFSIPLIVDSTCATPAITRPLLFGADIVVHSASKAISSSGTSIAGLIVARKNIISKIGPDEMKADFASWAKLWPFRDNGPSIHPMAAIMTLNDMRSLRMMVDKMSQSALQIAEYLHNHPKIETTFQEASQHHLEI